MKPIATFATIFVGALLLSACGSPAPEPTAIPTIAEPTQTAPAPAEAMATPLPATTTTRVEILLTDNVIRSSVSSFETGVSYDFVITNNGRHEHNFNVAPPVSLAGGYAEALAQALLAVDETQIPPGSSVTVEFTFPQSSAGATLEFSCLIRRHYEDGMRQDITVTN
jgi:uncharacterized cupredoxin-like copper-binding protein